MITQDDIRYLALLQHMRPRNHKTRVSHDNCGILELFCEKSKMQEVMRINYHDTFGEVWSSTLWWLSPPGIWKSCKRRLC